MQHHPTDRLPIHVMLIGDCTLSTGYLPFHLRNEVILAKKLQDLYPNDPLVVTNEGLDAESTSGFLRRYDRTFARHPKPDYVVIRYGVNDRRDYGVEGFEHHLTTLLDRLHADFPDLRILLETGIFVDYPAHYEFDRNTVLQPIYEVIRRLSRDRNLPLVDVYHRMEAETQRGNWDLRVRGYGVVDEEIPVLGAGHDHLHGNDVRWFTNIHPNPEGIAVIADEEARVFREHWPVTLDPQIQAIDARNRQHHAPQALADAPPEF